MVSIVCNTPWTENYATVTEQIFVGVTMTLLGISIVVLVLALISIFVSFMSKVINTSSGKKAAPQVQAASRPVQPATQHASAPAFPASHAASGMDQHVLAAVLAAAVAAYTSGQKTRSSAGFTIRRIRRV